MGFGRYAHTFPFFLPLFFSTFLSLLSPVFVYHTFCERVTILTGYRMQTYSLYTIRDLNPQPVRQKVT